MTTIHHTTEHSYSPSSVLGGGTIKGNATRSPHSLEKIEQRLGEAYELIRNQSAVIRRIADNLLGEDERHGEPVEARADITSGGCIGSLEAHTASLFIALESLSRETSRLSQFS